MATIKLSNFGGEIPSASARSIPAESARTTINLYPRTREFRPQTTDLDTTTIGVSNPKSIYKLSRNSDGSLTSASQGWKTDVGGKEVNYVRGPLDDDFTERTYYTYADGSTPPRVLDATGADRRLGVPMPSAKPGTSLIAGYEFTTDDAETAAAEIPARLLSDTQASTSAIVVGNTPTLMSTTAGVAAGTFGWVAHGTAVTTISPDATNALPTTSTIEYAFLCPMTRSGSLDVMLYPQISDYLLATQFNGKKVIYPSSASATTNTFWAVPVVLRAVGFSLDAAGLSTRIQAYPDPVDGSPAWIPPANADAFAAAVAAYFDPTKPPISTAITALNTAQVALFSATGNSYTAAQNQTATTDKVKAFYTSTANSLISAMTTQFGTDVVNAQKTVYTNTKYNSGAGYTSWGGNILSAATVAAQALSLIYQATDGTKWLDAPGLRTYLIGGATTNFAAVATAVESPVMADEFSAQIATLVSNLAANVAPSYWATNYAATWPLIDSPAEPILDRQTAVANAQTDLRIASDRVTAEFLTVANRGKEILSHVYDDPNTGLATQLPTPTVAQIDTRFYVYTWVTDWHEESAPSLPSTSLDVGLKDSVTVTVGTPPVGRNIVGWRLYRSNSGSTATAFELVTETDTTAWPNVQLATDGSFDYFKTAMTTYTDDHLGAELGEVIPTTTWLEPPAPVKNSVTVYLQGLVGVANGILAGFYDNVLAFCEPYVPYAWPEEYQQTTRWPIVGLGAFGSTVFVGTRGNPYLASGADSASMSLAELPQTQACVSARSIASFDTGVLYASPDGICMADLNGVRLLTEGLFTRPDWQTVLGATPESTVFAATHDGVYYLAYSAGVYQFDSASGKLTELTISPAPSAMFNDKVTDTLYIVTSTTVKALFGSSSKRTGTYRTGIIKLARPAPFAWLQVDSDFSSTVTINWYGDGVLRYSATPTTTRPIRAPAGVYLEHEIEIISAARVTMVTFAGSVDELQTA